jgi:hypothetical protein
MPVPNFSPGEVLTAGAMDSIGMWKVGSYTVSGTVFNIDGCFTSDYDSYKIVFQGLGASGNSAFYVKLRSGGATTANNYYSGMAYAQWSGTILAQSRSNSSDGWYLSFTNGTNVPIGGSMDIYNPNKASARTGFSYAGNFWDAGIAGGGYHPDTTQFDGISLICGSSLSGTVIVYGYTK